MIELLEFIKKISFVTYNDEYISKINEIIKTIDEKFKNIDITKCLPQYYGFKEINISQYEHIHCKINNIINNDLHFPIFYCDDKDLVMAINNIGQTWCDKKGFEFDNIKITKYYVVLEIIECIPSNDFSIKYIPANYID